MACRSGFGEPGAVEGVYAREAAVVLCFLPR
jgi:hypothetical protein